MDNLTIGKSLISSNYLLRMMSFWASWLLLCISYCFLVLLTFWGILALAVLGLHIPLKNEFTRHIKKGIGVIIEPVDVFLLLSGLACGRGYANKPWSIRAIVLFYQKRLRRILPVYLFAISIMRIFDHQTNVSKYLSPVEYFLCICYIW